MSEADDRIRGLIHPEILALSSYHVPSAQGLVKLDAMENPYVWPKAMVNEWLERLRSVQPNRYPDPACAPLKRALAASAGIPAGMELLLGNGSDEIIQILLMAVARPGVTIMAPEPTFVMYRQISQCLGLRFLGIPLRAADFSLDIDAMLDAIDRERPALIFLSYPNNPTGNLFDTEAVDRILERAPGLVVLDEAYAPYAGATYMSRLGEWKHLLVMRTLSKLGLAGLRLGFLAGHSDWITELDKVRLPYNINVLTQTSAEFALEKQAILNDQVEQILVERRRLFEHLGNLPGITVFPSNANFLLLRISGHAAGDVFARLKASGILIKNLHPVGGLLHQCLRVTVGTPEENSKFLGALENCLAA